MQRRLSEFLNLPGRQVGCNRTMASGVPVDADEPDGRASDAFWNRTQHEGILNVQFDLIDLREGVREPI